MQYTINTFSFHRLGFFHKCLLCIRVLFYGFMPKIIFFYAEKLRAILVWFFFLIPNAIQNFYRSSKKSKFWLPNTFHLLQETVNNESYSPQNLPYNLDLMDPAALLYTHILLWFFYHYRIQMIHLSLKVRIDRQLQFTMCWMLKKCTESC